MAAGLSHEGELVPHNYKESDVNQQFSCNYCFKYKCELKELTQEPLSAKKIIQLLQEDLNTYKDPTVTRTSDDRSNSHVSSYLSNNWEIVADKSINPKKLNRTSHGQLPIPVIPITNRYSALHNLQNDTELPSNIPNHHTKYHHIKKNAFLKQNKARSSPTRKLKRILLIGSSHMCGCASELRKYLGSDYQVSGTVMPGSRLQNITKLARNEIAGF
jgi:hypothetical protein